MDGAVTERLDYDPMDEAPWWAPAAVAALDILGRDGVVVVALVVGVVVGYVMGRL